MRKDMSDDTRASGLYIGELQDASYYIDHPTKCIESEIFELENGLSFAYVDMVDEDGEETAFKEVVNFYQDQTSKQFLTKNCELRIKHFLDEEDETFEYVGEPYVVNLEHYVNKENVKKELYFTPKDKKSDI